MAADRSHRRFHFGVKGAGEAGTVGSLPSVMNAINDALASAGAGHIEMPATAEKVWKALKEKSKSAKKAA